MPGQAGELVLPQLAAQRIDVGIIGRSLRLTIIAVIIIGAVAIVSPLASLCFSL